MRKTPWNKGLTKETSPKLAALAKQKSDWWKENDTTETRKKIGIASKGRIQGMEKHPAWKGGRYTDKRDGYVFVRIAGHAAARSDGYALEHRVVMEELLGRPLLKDEDVNHLNGKKNDNRPENLRLVRHYAHFEEMECPKCSFVFHTK